MIVFQRVRGAAVTLCAAILVWGVLMLPAAAKDLPDYVSVYVNDFADILSPETEAELTRILQQAREARDHEMTVVTIKSRHAYGGFRDIASFSDQLFNKWGVGNAERNDGLMMVVAVEDRDMRIALGSGYRARYDGIAKRIIDSIVIPAFKDGRMEQGILEGTRASLDRLQLDTRPASELSPMERVQRWTDEDPKRKVLLVILGIFGAPITAILGFFGIRWGVRNAPRKCPECGRRMVRLGDVQEDQYLDAGQLVEERLNSKDYGVWVCEYDDHIMVKGYPKVFSSHGACPNCRYKTYHTRTTVLRNATTSSTGLKRLDHSCKNCGHTASEDRTIPRRTQSSSSSSSSGGSSSFGGGSSSGGGASGSW